MVSVMDISDLLDKIELWRTLKALPGRVATLEAKIAEMERKGARPAEACPLCGGEFPVTEVNPDPKFKARGIQRRTHTCKSCGHFESRQFDPNERR